MGLLNFEDKDNTVLQNVKTTPPTTELSSHRPEPSKQQIQNQIPPIQRCFEICYTRYLKSRLESNFCLHKTHVQFSEYVSTNLNILLVNEGKYFSKYEYISKIQDTVL
jgi:hypothetical protein